MWGWIYGIIKEENGLILKEQLHVGGKPIGIVQRESTQSLVASDVTVDITCTMCDVICHVT